MVEALICTQNWLKPSDNDLNVLNMTEEYEISESIVSEFQVATGGAAAPTQAGPSFFETKDGTVSVATAFAGHQEDLGINKSIFIKPKTFHLTVLMLKLWNKDRVGHIKRRLNSSSFLLNGRERKVDSELPCLFLVSTRPLKLGGGSSCDRNRLERVCDFNVFTRNACAEYAHEVKTSMASGLMLLICIVSVLVFVFLMLTNVEYDNAEVLSNYTESCNKEDGHESIKRIFCRA
ncbi:hypothetical protein KIW84_074286 [Lathyrus oleraceus]|uniref:A-kinase anchor protein 7-like phosphoesterase domain-containing protein n=1 Tax=Pisum sativum TaxID=3888 RepID=A0A9D4ZXU1_PEA|nr:hypothetical protein KIW84_074286 [Pisum sativum]